MSYLNHTGSPFSYTPEQRARAAYYYLGWQGGTVHQLSKEFGLTVSQILYDDLVQDGAAKSDFTGGWFGIRTCDRDWRVNTLLLKVKGNFEYFSGLVRGFWVTGPLDEKEG